MVLAALVVAGAIAALFVGSAPVSPSAVLAVLTGRGPAQSVERVVILDLGCRASPPR